MEPGAGCPDSCGPGYMEKTRELPGSTFGDATFAALRDGYIFIQKRCRQYDAPAFRTRLLFQRTICLSGRAGAELFYDSARFQRSGAAPRRMQRTLVGDRTIQSTDDITHHERKMLFLSLLADGRIRGLRAAFEERWRIALRRWASEERVVLFTEMGSLLTRAVCAWTGVPLPDDEAEKRVVDIRSVIDGAGGVGPRYWRGRRARTRADAWMRDVIERSRAGKIPVVEGSALHAVANFRGASGALFDAETAGQELFNIVRPTVAVDRFITFAALALHEHPESRSRVVEPDYLHWFVQEVRRYYPFFPFAVARTRAAFEWQGFHFPGNTRTLLDLYGTDHDAARWEEPEKFRPERFANWEGNMFTFIPQGGGDPAHGHRCPGEWVVIELMKTAVLLLTKEMSYQVPPQDLYIRLSRMPAIPKSRFVISRVRPEH